MNMNANEAVAKPGLRLNRIKLVSQIFRILIGVLVVALTLVSGLICLASIVYALNGGWPAVGKVHATSFSASVSFSPHQSYAWPFSIPLPVFLVGAVQLGLLGSGLIVLNRLFALYERGDFFKTGNIRCIKWLGLIVMGVSITQTLLELMAHQNHLDGSGLVFGFLVVFIAWIMDEGRKIQEEQELTV